MINPYSQNSYILNLIREHQYEYPDQEVCGYIKRGNVIRQINQAVEPSNSFIIGGIDFARDQDAGLIDCVYHTHLQTGDFYLSNNDVKASRRSELPYLVVHSPTGKSDYFNPKTIDPYVGREWVYSHSNCYTLMNDWYKRELNIMLPEFYLESKTAWRDKVWDEFRKNLPINGFVNLGHTAKIQTHDVIIMGIGAVANHCGVIVDASKNLMLHHLLDRLSEHSIFDDAYRSRIAGIYRHRSLM